MKTDKKTFILDFRYLLKSIDKNDDDIAKILGVTRSAVAQRTLNGSWKYVDFCNILDSLGYDIMWVKKEDKDNGIVENVKKSDRV